MKQKIDLTVQRNDQPAFSPDEQVFYSLRERALALAEHNKIDDDVANGLIRYFSTCFTYFTHDNDFVSAQWLQEGFAQTIDTLEQLEDRAVVLRIAKVIKHWINSTDEVYRTKGKFELYLDGQQRMFKNIFGFINSPFMEKYHTQETKQALVTILDTKQKVA